MTTHRNHCPRCNLDDLILKARPDSAKARAQLYTRLTAILGEEVLHSAAAHAKDDEIEEIIELLEPIGNGCQECNTPDCSCP